MFALLDDRPVGVPIDNDQVVLTVVLEIVAAKHLEGILGIGKRCAGCGD